MKKCPFCAEDILNDAIVCRYCKRDLNSVAVPSQPEPDKKSGTGGVPCAVVFLVIIVLVGALLFVSSLRTSPSRTSKPDTGSDIGASLVCRKFVKDRLKAPSTAEFPGGAGTYEDGVSKSGGIYTVKAYVDAENSFGAMIRTNYICKVTYTGDDNWHLESLQMDE